MSNAVHKFNGLNGTVVSREEITRLIELAIDQEQPEVVARLETVLSKYDHDRFEIEIAKPIEVTAQEPESSSKINKVVSATKEAGLKAPTSLTKETTTFNKQILQAKRNGINPRKVFTLGKTKGILKKYLGDNSLTISGEAIKKAMDKDGDHIATFEHFINLPDSINNPIAIFKSKTRNEAFVVITEIKTHKEKPLMVALHINNSFKIGKIASVYNRKRTNDYRKWKKEDLAIYVNEKPFDALLSGTIPVSQTTKGQRKDTKNSKTTKNSKSTSGLKVPTSKETSFKRKKSNWKSTRHAWQDVAKKTGLHHSQVKSNHTETCYVWNVISGTGLKAPRKSKALTECEKKLPEYEIVKKKSKVTSSKKDFIVTIPIESIINDFDTKTIDKDKVKALVSSGTNKIEPLKVYQDKKDNKIYLLKGKEELEALIKLNEENAPVVFSKTAPKKVVGLNGYVPKDPTINKAIQYAEKHLIGKSIYHPDIDKKILFTAAGIKKAIQGKTKPTRTRIQLVFLAKDLVKKARLFETKKDKKGRSDIVAYHTLRTTTTMDGKRFEVIIKIQEKKNGSLYYDHTGVELKKQINVPGDKSEPLGRVNLPSSPKGSNKDTKKTKTTKKGLKSPAIAEPNITLQPEPQPPAQQDRGGQVAPDTPVIKNSKVRNMAATDELKESQFYTVAGEVGKFLQAVERKPKESVVITLDGHQGAGKTTALYQFMDAFAKGGNRGIFFSLEEHHESYLSKEKANKYLSPESQTRIDIVSDVEDTTEFYDLVSRYDVVFIDSWQKLVRMIGAIRLDEDLRKKFDGKVFVVVFQQTTTGRTKGGAEIVFDGDVIVKMVKEQIFENNYAYFDKNRYTREPLENLRYNIAGAYMYNPNETTDVSNIDFTEAQPEPVVDGEFCIQEVN